jgi:hypothetical protein
MASPAATRQMSRAELKDEFGDDFAYVAPPPPRPVFNPEEGEPDRSDWVSLVKAVVLGVLAICVLGWLLRH